MNDSSRGADDLEKGSAETNTGPVSRHSRLPESDPRFCDHRSFAGRFQQSLYRADRNDRQVMLLLIRIDGYFRARERVQMEDTERLLNLTLYRIGSCLRRGDTLASIGEGLFAILLEEIRDASAVPMAIEKIHTALSHPFHVDRVSISVHYCTGASLFPMDGYLCSQLWTQAKMALDTATENGHGAFSLTPQMMGHTATEGAAQSRELYQAAQSDQLQLLYQPVFECSGRRVVSVEALVRWQHPLHGMLEPQQFMPVLEDTGLIIPVGERLIQQACQLASTLQKEGHSSIRVCINISARQFADTGFLLSVVDAIHESNVSPSLIELEITAETLLNNADLSQRLLSEFQAIGISITVDRFGAGSSSLTELIRLPLAGLKIDSELVKGLPVDRHDTAVTAGVFTMAQGAGLKTSASGIETENQVRYLKEMGCDQLQGFYFTRPMRPEELMHWLPN